MDCTRSSSRTWSFLLPSLLAAAWLSASSMAALLVTAEIDHARGRRVSNLSSLWEARSACPCLDTVRKEYARAAFRREAAGLPITDRELRRVEETLASDPNSSDLLVGLYALHWKRGTIRNDLKERLRRLRTDIR